MLGLFRITLGLLIAVASATSVWGQNNSIMQGFTERGVRRPLSMAQGNLIRSPAAEPRKLRVHDKVSIRVQELARAQSEGSLERRKNASINAILQDWVRLNGFTKAEKTQASGEDPQIQGQLQELYRAEADFESTERLTFNIATEVVDLRPNGQLILEGRKQIKVNDETWLYELHGVCDQRDIGVDGVILSDDVMDLKITKRESGAVRDGYRRGALLRFFDQVRPF